MTLYAVVTRALVFRIGGEELAGAKMDVIVTPVVLQVVARAVALIAHTTADMEPTVRDLLQKYGKYLTQSPRPRVDTALMWQQAIEARPRTGLSSIEARPFEAMRWPQPHTSFSWRVTTDGETSTRTKRWAAVMVLLITSEDSEPITRRLVESI